jgi:hypothetical protein
LWTATSRLEMSFFRIPWPTGPRKCVAHATTENAGCRRSTACGSPLA